MKKEKVKAESFELQSAIELIKNNENFLKLKNIIEVNPSHDHEPAYDHSVKTYEIAKKKIAGDFLTNEIAKEKFQEYFGQSIGGIEKRDLMLIATLIHDIGKLIVFDRNRPLFTTGPNGNTDAAEHGYWGSLIVRDVTKGVNLPEEAIEYLGRILRLHLYFIDKWLSSNDFSAEELMRDAKLRAENLHVDVSFNLYCDIYDAPWYQAKKQKAEEIFNMPEFYNPVEFSIMD